MGSNCNGWKCQLSATASQANSCPQYKTNQDNLIFKLESEDQDCIVDKNVVNFTMSDHYVRIFHFFCGQLVF